MNHWRKSLNLIAAAALALLLALPAAADHHRGPGAQSDREHRGQRMQHGQAHEHRLFVTVTGAATQDRAMPLVLANQAAEQGLEVRVLLCGDGARLAIADYSAETFAPRNISAQDLLKRLVEQGATVEVCAIFLPNTDYSEADLIDGIGVAGPAEVASWMMGPRTRILSM